MMSINTKELLTHSKSNFKKTKSFILFFVLILFLLLNTVDVKAQFAGGSGTEGDPYQISTIEQLDSVRIEGGYNVFFILMNDINASVTRNWNEGKGFFPIGGANIDNSSFAGYFDGQGFTIDSLYINSPGYQVVGLFGFIHSQGVLSNINLTNHTIIGNSGLSLNSTDLYLGSLVGLNEGKIINSHSSGTIEGLYVGGLTAVNAGIIEHCDTFVKIDGSSASGGIAAINVGVISETNSRGTISNASYAGGLVGINAIKSSVGHKEIEGVGEISSSYSEINLDGAYTIGGLVGENRSFNTLKATIINSYSTGIVSGNERVGGIIGANSGIVSYSYSTAQVSGDSDIGGLVGYDFEDLTFTNNGEVFASFWDTETSEQATSAGGIGKTTAEMTKKSTFLNEGWDYATIWIQRPSINESYPQLDFAVGAIADSGSAPAVSNVTISGSFVAGNEMKVSYNYVDEDEDYDRSSFQWYRYDDLLGANKVLIPEANKPTFIPSSEEIGKYINVEVTPTDFLLTGSIVTSEIVGTFTIPFIGDGTKENPFEINSLNQLQSMGQFLSSDFKLMNDINASPTGTWNKGAGFVPIGSLETPFKGFFKGQDFAIDSLYINMSDGSYLGLFGLIDTLSSISNLSLTNSIIDGRNETSVDNGSSYAVGGLAGANAGTIYNVSVEAEVSGSTIVGGLVGSNRSSASIKNSSSGGSVYGNSTVGGLVGLNSGLIDSSNTDVEVTATGNNVGGFVGSLGRTGDISNSYAKGRILANQGRGVGGFAGTTSQGLPYLGAKITNSYSIGDVFGDTYVGGLVGSNQVRIIDSYSTGNVNGDSEVGGLVGTNWFQSITNSYSIGTVSARNNVGGLVGFTLEDGIIINSFWDIETSEQVTSAGGVGKTTAEMQLQATYEDTGWDFITVWAIEEGLGYPYFNTDSATVSTEISDNLPNVVELQQNYPNPFNPSTTINFSVPQQSTITLEVFDMLGRKVSTLIDGEGMQVGRYSVLFNASALSSGMYFYRLKAGSKVLVQKMTLIK